MCSIDLNIKLYTIKRKLSDRKSVLKRKIECKINVLTQTITYPINVLKRSRVWHYRVCAGLKNLSANSHWPKYDQSNCLLLDCLHEIYNSLAYFWHSAQPLYYFLKTTHYRIMKRKGCSLNKTEIDSLGWYKKMC